MSYTIKEYLELTKRFDKVYQEELSKQKRIKKPIVISRPEIILNPDMYFIIKCIELCNNL